jgi:hypothetical protein
MVSSWFEEHMAKDYRRRHSFRSGMLLGFGPVRAQHWGQKNVCPKFGEF